MRQLLSLFSIVGLLLWACLPSQAIQLLVKQGSTSPIQFLLVDASTGQTGQTGQAGTVVIKISKAGGAALASAGTIAEVDQANIPGLYAYTPTATETNALGILTLHITCTGCQIVDTSAQIVAFDPNTAAVVLPVTPPTGYGIAGYYYAPVLDAGATASTSLVVTVTNPTNSPTSRLISWTADSLATSYKVMRSTDGVNYTKIATISAGTLSYTDAARPAGNVYYSVISVH